MAPRSEVPETVIDAAPADEVDLRIAAFKSRLPVMLIAPSAFVPPTTPLSCAVPVPILNVRSRAVALALLIVEVKVTLLSVVVRATSVLNVTAPVYVCVAEVVTLAPRSDAPETESDVADVIAALRSRAPVILIAPNVLVPPMMPLNCALPELRLNVRLLVSAPSELIVELEPLNVTWSSLVVMVIGSLIMAPPAAENVNASSVEMLLPR